MATSIRFSSIKLQRFLHNTRLSAATPLRTSLPRSIITTHHTRLFTSASPALFSLTPTKMGVHNLAEYVAYHQAKLRQEQQQQQQARNSSSSSSSPSTPAKRYGVNPIHSKTSFNTSVLSAPADRLVVLDCFATWCGPCKVIAPELVKFSESEEFKDKVDFYKIDVDEAPDVAQELGVRAMPTFMLFKNGQKVGEVVGANKKALEQAIRSNL